MNINKRKFEIAIANACILNKELSEKTGIRQETIARVKNGANVSPVTVGKIAKALGVTVQELIETEAATSNQASKGSESN